MTPDAASTFIGGAVLYLACRWDEGGKWRWLALIGIGVVGTAFKIQDSIIVMMISLYFLLRIRGEAPLRPAVDDAEGGDGRALPVSRDGLVRRGTRMALRLGSDAYVRAVGIIVITTLVIASSWTFLQRATETIDPNKLLVNQQFVVSSITWPEIATAFGIFLSPLAGGFVPTALQNVWTGNMVSILSWLLVAGVIAGALFRARTPALASLARATLVLALVGGPIFVVLNYLSMSQYIVVPTRYGFTLLPAMVLCTADAIRTRWAGIVVLGTAFISVAFVALRMASQ